MMNKNLPDKHRKRILFIRMTLDGISAVHSLMKGDVSVLKAVWKAHKSYRKLRGKYYRKTEIIAYPSCVYQQSVAYQYFVRGCKTFVRLGRVLPFE